MGLLLALSPAVVVLVARAVLLLEFVVVLNFVASSEIGLIIETELVVQTLCRTQKHNKNGHGPEVFE